MNIGSPNSLMRRITELPEPDEPKTSYNVRTQTPWGLADSATYYGTGIVQYTTPSHGGFHVSAGLLASIPEYLQTADAYADGTRGWYKEDCAWSIVVLCFPERFSGSVRQDAVVIMRKVYPKQFERLCTD